MTGTLHRYRGEMLSLSEIARRVGIGQATLYHRVHRAGMSIEEATARPVDQRCNRARAKLYLFRGQPMTMMDVARLLGVTVSTVAKRRSGDTILEGADLIDPFPDPHPRARMLTLRNRTMSIADWSRETGVREKTIAQRIAKGWPVHYALTVPPHVGGFDTITYAGRTMTLGQWARKRGLYPQTLRLRLLKGWTVERALTTPVRKSTGGSSSTSADASGTGVGRQALDLQSEGPASP